MTTRAISKFVRLFLFTFLLCTSFSHAYATDDISAAVAETATPVVEDSYTNLYEVTDIMVDKTAVNAVEAREQAMVDARNQAYQKLAARILPATQVQQLQIPEDLVISSLIDSLQVESEKLSSTRYHGDVSVAFNPSAVRAHFGPYGNYVQQVDRLWEKQRLRAASQKSFLILPWYENSGSTALLWGDQNPWAKEWQTVASMENGIYQSQFIVPVGDVLDIRDFSPSGPLTYNDLRLQQLAARYGTEETIIALAERNPQTMVVKLYATSRGAPEEVGSYEVPVQSEDADLSNAVIMALERLDNMAMTTSATEQPNVMIPQNSTDTAIDGTLQDYKAVTAYGTLQEWLSIKSTLDSIPVIKNLTVINLSPKQAQLRFQYRGSPTQLNTILESYGFGLGNLYDSYAYADAGNGTVFTIVRTRYR